REIKGFSEADARHLVASRGAGYTSVHDLWRRSGLSLAALERLADADAFASLGLSRRQALWAVKALGRVGDQDDLPLLMSASPPSAMRRPALQASLPLEGGGSRP